MRIDIGRMVLFLPVNTLQNTENAKTARVITPSNTRLPSLNFQNIFRMCYSTFSLLWSVYKYALFVVEHEKTTKSTFEGKNPRALTPWVLNWFSQKLQGRRSSSRWLFFLLLVYTKYVSFVWYCGKSVHFDFDLEIWPWWVFCKNWPLPESYSLWCVDTKSVIKSICASISSGWFRS